MNEGISALAAVDPANHDQCSGLCLARCLTFLETGVQLRRPRGPFADRARRRT